MNSANRTLSVTLLLAALSFLSSAYVAYSSETSAVLQRLRAVETQLENDKNRLERIEDKLDRLFEVTTGRRPN